MPLVAPPPADRFWGSGAEHGARFFLFGAPLDLTGSGRLGTGQAPPAVRQASHSIESYSPKLDGDLFEAGLTDLGDLDLAGLPMETALAEIEHQTAEILARTSPPEGAASRTGAASDAPTVGASLAAPAVPIVVGGEHTIALAIGRAVKRRYQDAVIISLDAHLDLADELDGRKVAHGTWACRLGEELGGFGDFVLLGMRSGTRDEWRRSKSCLWQSPAVTLPDSVRDTIANRPIYLSVDIDVLDPSVAPGTGNPEPGGPSFEQLLEALEALADLDVVACDVVEVSPPLDPSGITLGAAAILVLLAILLLMNSVAIFLRNRYEQKW
jgi:agmatinase